MNPKENRYLLFITFKLLGIPEVMIIETYASCLLVEAKRPIFVGESESYNLIKFQKTGLIRWRLLDIRDAIY